MDQINAKLREIGQKRCAQIDAMIDDDSQKKIAKSDATFVIDQAISRLNTDDTEKQERLLTAVKNILAAGDEQKNWATQTEAVALLK